VPIRLVTTAAGERFRVTLDRAPDPITLRRRQVSRVYSTALDALEGLEKLRADLAALDAAERNPDAGPVTLDVACDRWLASKDGKVRSNTLESYRYALLPVRRFMGDRDVTTLLPTDVEALVGWLTREGGKRG
jgi:hypothetical protein